jgi:hypothetical protein
MTVTNLMKSELSVCVIKQTFSNDEDVTQNYATEGIP